ncbi:MAG: hypothetical protein WBN74_04350, partial [Candidatus Sulfotelmatobacter sp.]
MAKAALIFNGLLRRGLKPRPFKTLLRWHGSKPCPSRSRTPSIAPVPAYLSRHCNPLSGCVSFNPKGITLQAKVPAGLDRKEAEVYRHLDPG